MKQAVIKHKSAILVAVLIAFALLARFLGMYGIYIMPLGLAHTMICVGICIGWGLSVNFRILQKSVRRYVVCVAAMEVFWFVARSLKYYFIANPTIDRYLWYLYYIPMLCIPFFAVLASEKAGKPETERLPKWTAVLFVALAALSIIVLSNDLHSLVFTFPEGAVWTDDDYGYGIVFYLIWAFEIICSLITFVILFRKSRYAMRYKYLPAFLTFLCNIFTLIYIMGVGSRLMKLLFGDIVMLLSLMIIAVFESAVKSGLIQTNTGYQSLFRAGSFGAVIVDNGSRIRYASANAPILTKAMIEQAKLGAVALDRDTILKCNPIDSGYVYWREDISAINALLERLSETKESIAESNILEGENYKAKQKINALREKNRLYDLLQEKTAPQIDMLDRLFTEYDHEQDSQKQRVLLAKIAVVGAYIKRCGNLLFISEKAEITTTSELSLCEDETFANLKLMGVDCETDITQGIPIYSVDAIRVYEFSQKVIEASLDSLKTVWLKLRVKADELIFRLEVECDEYLGELSEKAQFEDGVWSFTLRIGKAGDEQ